MFVFHIKLLTKRNANPKSTGINIRAVVRRGYMTRRVSWLACIDELSTRVVVLHDMSCAYREWSSIYHRQTCYKPLYIVDIYTPYTYRGWYTHGILLVWYMGESAFMQECVNSDRTRVLDGVTVVTGRWVRRGSGATRGTLPPGTAGSLRRIAYKAVNNKDTLHIKH